MFILKIKISSLDIYFKGQTRLIHFSKKSWKKAGRIPGEAPDFLHHLKYSALNFGGFQAFLQKKIVVTHPHIISGKNFGLREFDGNIR